MFFKIYPFPFSIQHSYVYLKLITSSNFYVANRAWFPVFLFQSSLWGLCSCLYLLKSVWHPSGCGNLGVVCVVCNYCVSARSVQFLFPSHCNDSSYQSLTLTHRSLRVRVVQVGENDALLELGANYGREYAFPFLTCSEVIQKLK